MNHIEIIQSIQEITDESKIHFSVGDEKAENRFDYENANQYEEGNLITEISYMLYSYIANAIIFKAQGKEKSEYGYSLFDKQWEDLIQKKELSLFDNQKVIKDDAMRLLGDFLFTAKDIRLNQLIDKFLPICILKESIEHKESERKAIRAFKKKKDVITNQVTLFIRSLYHAFLTRSDILPLQIHPDDADLSNGIFSYNETSLYFSTWQNAFTLESYKKVIKKSLLLLSSSFPIESIKKISVIFLSKDIIATIDL